MNRALFRFELNYHFRQLSFLLAGGLFVLLGMFIAAKANFGGGAIYKNSVYVNTYILSFLSLFSIFSATLFCANVVLRDTVYQVDSILYSTRIKRHTYFIIRFIGLFISVFIHLCCAAIGLWIGTFFVDSEQLGAYNVLAYLHPLLIFGLPNVLLSVSCIFCTAILTKHVRAIYAVGVLLYIIYMVASILGNSPIFATSALSIKDPGIGPYLADPFGLTSFFDVTRKWTDAVKNTRFFPLQNLFLLNRALWISVSLLLLFISYRYFNFRLAMPRTGRSNEKPLAKPLLIKLKPVSVQPKGAGYNWQTFNSQFKLESISLFKHIPFMVMLLLWLFVFGVELKDTLFNGAYGIQAYPTTGFIIEEMRVVPLALLLLIFYAAEICGRERSTKTEPLIFSTPLRPFVLWISKSMTLLVLVMVLISLNILIGLGVQLTKGYTHFDWDIYLSLYYYSGVPLFLFAILIMSIQSLMTNRYMGMLVNMVLVFVIIFSSQLGIEHYLFRYATVPDMEFSYFNGFGHYVKAFNWYMAYWFGLAICIAVISVGMWPTGMQQTFSHRLRNLRMTGIKSGLIGGAGLLLFVGCGSYIYYQTNRVGKYQNKNERRQERVAYEQRYGRFAGLPQPVIKSVKLKVDLFPGESYYTVKGTYIVKNETEKAIAKLWLNVDRSVTAYRFSVQGGTLQRADMRFGQQFFDLNTPLHPQQTLKVSFELTIVRNGFTTFDNENSLVKNGSYIELEKFVPHFGFDAGWLIEDKQLRKTLHLPEELPVVPASDAYELIDLETTISTSADQQVVTVGELKRSWQSHNRRYFTYKTPQPIAFMFALSSAAYEVKKEVYNGITLRLYYLKGQEYNLLSMFKAIRETLDYGSATFGAYPLKQFSMAEIPQYRGAATAYPGLIFSTERINFLSNHHLTDKIDQAYAITSHEVAHQWWANMLNPASVPGRPTLTESLAKYTENIRIEKTFGKMYLQKYMALDNRLYFTAHNPEEEEESLSEANSQSFVYYQKGGLIMYAIKEALGEKIFNKVLKQLVENHHNPNRKATMKDFYELLLAHAPESQKNFIRQSLMEVTTYSMAVKVLRCVALANGQFKIDLQLTAKLNVQGSAARLSPDMDVDIAAFDVMPLEWADDTRPLFIQKYRLKQPVNEVSIIMNKKPKIVAIDPYQYLLDDNKDDNVAEIK